HRATKGDILRAALQLIGRLAAGERSAILGTRPLKMLPHIMRQKVSREYRLLFELRKDTLHVIDLIPRKDLETWIRKHR
ncbi:MAG: hypothetical protein AAGJ31_15650, partial [Verrucomicrobiota bacterium]